MAAKVVNINQELQVFGIFYLSMPQSLRFFYYLCSQILYAYSFFMIKDKLFPDYIFESSWEVCNKVGGIYTVLSTRAKTLQEILSSPLLHRSQLTRRSLRSRSQEYHLQITATLHLLSISQTTILTLRMSRFTRTASSFLLLLKRTEMLSATT